MSNAQRNIEAVNIFRPVATGQVRPNRANNGKPDVEAAITAIVRALFGVDLLPPRNPATMWAPPARRAV